MNIPENCRECEHTNTCWAYYGGGMCKHRAAIEQETASREREAYQK